MSCTMHADGVLLKVGHFTMDNASNNDTMMVALAKLLKQRDISFDARDRRVMCFAHIVNLCSGRVISSVSKRFDGSLSDGSGSLSDGGATGSQSSDPIARARAVVRAIRETGTRLKGFEDVILQGNANGWFKDGELPVLQLLRDVRTRWDSVYHMLSRLRLMRPVCIYTLSDVIHTE